MFNETTIFHGRCPENDFYPHSHLFHPVVIIGGAVCVCNMNTLTKEHVRDWMETYGRAVNGNLGVVRWQSQFTFVASGQRLALDCLFVVEFNADGLCRTFREWWHIQEINHEHCGA